MARMFDLGAGSRGIQQEAQVGAIRSQAQNESFSMFERQQNMRLKQLNEDRTAMAFETKVKMDEANLRAAEFEMESAKIKQDVLLAGQELALKKQKDDLISYQKLAKRASEGSKYISEFEDHIDSAVKLPTGELKDIDTQLMDLTQIRSNLMLYSNNPDVDVSDKAKSQIAQLNFMISDLSGQKTAMNAKKVADADIENQIKVDQAKAATEVTQFQQKLAESIKQLNDMGIDTSNLSGNNLTISGSGGLTVQAQGSYSAGKTDEQKLMKKLSTDLGASSVSQDILEDFSKQNQSAMDRKIVKPETLIKLKALRQYRPEVYNELIRQATTSRAKGVHNLYIDALESEGIASPVNSGQVSSGINKYTGLGGSE